MFSVEVHATEVTAADMDLLKEALEQDDYSPALMAIYDYAIERTEIHFRTEGASGASGPWADYTSEPKYKNWKGSKLGVHGITPVLHWFGESSIKDALVRKGDPHHVGIITDKVFQYGTTLPFVEEINKGGRNMFGEPMKPRPVVSFTERDKEIMSKIMALYNSDPKISRTMLLRVARRNGG